MPASTRSPVSRTAPRTRSAFTDTGYGTLTINHVTVTGPATTTEDESLTAGGSIMGTVTDGTAAGNPPLDGVLVTCTCQSGTDTTDGSGNYSFTNIAASTYSVTFSETGYVTDTINNVVVTSGNQTTESPALTEDGGIAGTVSDANTSAPISGATVTCTSCPTTTAVTDGSGGYAFTDVIPGTYTVSVSAAGYTGQSNNGVVVNAGSPPTNQSFSLTPTASALSVAETFGKASSVQSTTLAATTSTPTGSGDLLVVTITGRSSPVSTVTVSDNSSGLNSWTLAPSTNVQNGQAYEAIYYVPNAASITSVTVTASVSSSLAITVLDIKVLQPV